MGRLTEDERREIKHLADRRKRMARARSRAIGYEDDIALTNEAWVAPSLSFAITRDAFECPNCSRADVECSISTSRSHTVRKTWRCPACRLVLVGQYTTYIIQEEPWRP